MRALTDQVKPLFGPAVTGITGGTPPATFARSIDASIGIGWPLNFMQKNV